MTAIDTRRHIEALQSAAIDLEAQLRAIGGYSRDCAHIHDALRGQRKHGFAVLFDGQGEPEIIPLGNESRNVEIQKGNAPDQFEVVYQSPADPQAAVGEYHVKHIGSEQHVQHVNGKVTKGFPPQSMVRERTADAAKRTKQTQDAAREKSIRMADYERNTLIAQRMKEASDRIWKKEKAASNV
ncbi:hypothetical protein [Methylocystis echinoides]|uniref:hypothetical protein n=1 Tax=Methylocystis echinoides TaxID=29468 RepID=UPI0034206401